MPRAQIKKSQVAKLLDDKFLIIEPLSYIRGRSLVKTCFIIDEAQNLLIEMKNNYYKSW